jgi:hypothetical protein
VNQDSLFNDLVAASKSEYENVFKKYPEIEEAEIIFKPFWRHSVPKDKDNIRLEEVLKE